MRFWSRRDGISFLLTFAVAMAVYVYALPANVTLEDAGELAVAADYLGVPHPPGYPIWTLLAWLFQWIFHFVSYQGYPNPAWAISFMSAFFGSMACGLVAVCIRKICMWLPREVATPQTPVFALAKMEALGAGISLGAFSVLLLAPAFGKALLLLGIFLFLLLLTLQSLRPL